MKRIVTDWYEAAFLMVQGFSPTFEPSPHRPRNLDAIFDDSEELEICSRDFRSNKGVPVLSLQAAMKQLASLNRKHGEGFRHVNQH